MGVVPFIAPMLSAKDVNVVYGAPQQEVHALAGVSFRVNEGEAYGLVGESGSGKSTVLRAICGLAPMRSGEVAIAGTLLPAPRDAAFYRQVQMVFQDPYGSLHPRHTVDRTLAEPIAIHRLDKPQERIVKALEEVGLSAAFRFRYPHQLSGGQRQRVAIARALILEPRILLLDEPTSALDASVQAEVLNLLYRLRKERGLTYILVSHDLAVVGHMCERLLVMQHGRAVEELSADTLRAQAPQADYTAQLLRASKGFERGGQSV